jgi:hypothetical protein
VIDSVSVADWEWLKDQGFEFCGWFTEAPEKAACNEHGFIAACSQGHAFFNDANGVLITTLGGRWFLWGGRAKAFDTPGDALASSFHVRRKFQAIYIAHGRRAPTSPLFEVEKRDGTKYLTSYPTFEVASCPTLSMGDIRDRRVPKIVDLVTRYESGKSD